jgi:hypothetical protein
MTLAWAAAAAQTVVDPEETGYPRYTVEVIIFEYAQEVSAGTEQFLPEEPPLPAPDAAEEQELVFGDAVAEPTVEEQAPAEDRHLRRNRMLIRQNRISFCTSMKNSP